MPHTVYARGVQNEHLSFQETPVLAQDPLCLSLSCPQALDNDMIYSVLNYVLYIDKLIYAF